jgi:hypothetical protein
MPDMKPEQITWSTWTRSLEHYLRLKTFPVGLKLLEDSGELSSNPWTRWPQEKFSLCQLIAVPEITCGFEMYGARPGFRRGDGLAEFWKRIFKKGKQCRILTATQPSHGNVKAPPYDGRSSLHSVNITSGTC